MASTKKRLNISLTEDLDNTLNRLAHRDGVPLDVKIAELLRMGLETEEDVFLDHIATKRYKISGVKLSHEKAWQ